MRNQLISFVFFLLIISCNNESAVNSATSGSDTVFSQLKLIRQSIDSAKNELITVQDRTKKSLDSLSLVLDEKSGEQALKPGEFLKIQSEVGKKLSMLDKISKLQPMEQNFNNLYDQLNSGKVEPVARKEKIEQLKSVSAQFLDSIQATLGRIGE
jgi:hypothetical protein